MNNKITSTKGSVPTGFADEIVISESTFRTAHRGPLNTQPSKKRKREDKGDSSTVYGASAYKGPWAKFKEDTPDASSGSEEEIEVTDSEGEDRVPPLKMATDYQPNDLEETTEFHGSDMYDYQGRTYMHIPPDLRGGTDELRNYVPKKQSHTWKDLQGAAITQIRFFPKSGHLLLAASASGKVKLFDVLNKDGHSRELLRSYSGHNKSCNDLCFNNDGTEFLTSSYDKTIKLWDTETGKCKTKFSIKSTPHVVRYNPYNNNDFLVGAGDNKIYQFDIRENKIEQEYDHHLKPVNTITFFDDTGRFVTTSDDKSLRAWEYGINVPIKIISEPDMYSMNRSAPHPRKSFIALQSSDNQIVVYAYGDKFTCRQNRKKSFRGHNNVGYAIDVAISTDGELVMSGDTGGYVCWWDWKSCKLLHKIQASDRAVLACQFHPHDASEAVTGDAEGIIKVWR